MIVFCRAFIAGFGVDTLTIAADITRYRCLIANHNR